MYKSKSALLNAYLDGELPVAVRQKLEQHLLTCRACQRELEQLRQVSTLLQTAPLPDFLPAELFADNLTRHLTPRPSPATRPHAILPSVYLMPLTLLTIWVLWQIGLTLSNLLDLAKSAGMLTVSVPGIEIGGQSLWVTLAQLLAGQHAPSWLSILASLSQWSWSLQIAWMIQAGIALAYGAWIFLWQRGTFLAGRTFSFHLSS